MDKLKLEDVPRPEAGPGEVLIKVNACALNYVDIWARRGPASPRVPMPHISGSDIAGEVAGLGAGSEKLKVGQRVAISPGISCGRCEYCLGGRDNFCTEYGIIGYNTNGGYAEYVSVPIINVVPILDNLNFVDAAAVPLVFLTAWHMMERAALQPGEWVLVVGAGGGVGTAVVQVAKFMGAKVIASAGREDKLQKCWELGADRLINNTTAKISDEVKKLTGGKGVQVVAETVGSALWNECLRSLAWGGRLVTAGGTTGTNVEIDTRFLYTKRQAIIGSYMGSKADLLKIFTFVQEGKLKPVVGRVMPLEKGAEAQVLMEERLHFGKIVLTV